MTEGFSSKALEANLARTRDAEIHIPEDQQWLIDLSKSKWGIHKRTKEFITELNHQYRNDSYVIDSLHNICLTDLWFYNSVDESERALSVLLDIFELLFDSEMEEGPREQLIKTLIKFMDRLANLENFPETIIQRCIDLIRATITEHELLYIRNSGYFKTYFNKIAQFPQFSQTLTELSADLLRRCIDYWESTSKADEWFQSKRHLFHHMDAETIGNIGKPFFDKLRKDLAEADSWEKISNLMFYNDISNYFRSFTETFDSYLETIYYLYYLLHLPGMSHLNDHLLYDMNRNLRHVFTELDVDDITGFLDTIMEQFQELNADHGGTVLDCIVTLGKEVIDTKDPSIITYFINGLIKLGFHYPGTITLNKDWQIQVNTNHVKNIRVWLELIEYAPSAMRELLAALIVNLKLGGIFISDTDLFQRDVTKLLNADIGPVYREMKQLARIFPVYFRDIGAEGKLREVSTAIDELSMRKDRLIHFLRKQTHTESNNTHILLTRKIIEYWYDGDKEQLKGLIPQDVYEWLDQGNEWFVPVHQIMQELCDRMKTTPEELLSADTEEIEKALSQINIGTEQHKKRVLYLFQVYNLLLEKYSLETDDVISVVRNSRLCTDEELARLEQNLENNRPREAVLQIYDLMNKLKEIILDPEPSEALENIYYKRHIAAGIPSMYGQYIEPKFESLGMMFRLEKTASKLMVELLNSVNLEYITAKTFRHIYDVLELFREGLALDGIYNPGLNSHIDMLKFSLTSPSFSLDQYINIFQFMAQDIKQIINEYFFDVYENSLKRIIPQLYPAPKEWSDVEKRQFYYMESEKFLRDNLASAFLVQDLDNFITTTLSNLRGMLDTYPHSFIENMMTFDPDLTFSRLNETSEEMDNPVFLGAKAFFLKKLIRYGFPVPPGFVLTTEVFRHKDTIFRHPHISSEFDRKIENNIKDIERVSGKKYGDPDNPLFFSVRSGSSISMPGAMRTFLNVGMNDEIAERLSRKKGCGWTTWDCYRRFLQSWGMAYGIERDTFDRIILGHKERWGVDLKIQFTKEQMKEIAYDYKRLLIDRGIHIEEDPFLQLKQAIISVLDSWSSKSAIYYRNHMQVADEWGTAVLVQQMALGNLSTSSGTGVVFTNSPFNGHSGINLYGDFALCSQGEDVVAGLVNTLPITEYQRKKYYTDSSISLESAFPRIYEALLDYATQLIEKYGFVHQEIEFTFESDDPQDLYILQTRNQNFKKQEAGTSFAKAGHEMKLVGRGIGVSSGVLSGVIAFDMDDLKELKKADPDNKVILVRPDTVPDDIPLIFNCDGLITGKGGTTSHAAVAAAGLGKICIVNCKGLHVNEEKKICVLNGHVFGPGDEISIDGDLGNVYEGRYEIQTEM
ncbi:MAG TPA: pyruvate phosphate dikinase [Clostridiales bacterium UBA9856]|jgi:pyruvate,orthophosphate dikinase|nr:pyruvate phosphate dikinase [Clostridiales bacterium UBA9856]HOA42045.1 PEP/pyruvate-binding domain-containing protein [Bacillota bacterium]HPZ59141.1 PEP/pyruvate-binding domain-containing protein [Bacillota bacterium]